MPPKRMQSYHRIALCLLPIAIGLPILLAMAATSDRASHGSHEVHIAFGFHVNLYHSFRNDTNDEDGFGKDIRIIRHIIRTLDRYNAMGIAVKGVWDFDNLFSLQEILPQYAPDIISDIRRRVQSNGDEVILMSYNNGLVSAMTEQELRNAVRWSVSNPWQSGVQDLFGTYTPVVRPQEMMTTPGNFSIYKENGIQAVALYYSATPFDTFRAFSRQLSRAEAHNPIRYRHPQTEEEMVIIPTYHIGDLVEHVSLKNWVGELNRLQSGGELNRDALIFINYDADSELWSGIEMPWPLKWLPNTDGLAGLIEEVSDLPHVRFTTLGDYLDDHPPVGTFSFSQDTADGSYNGYNSWAEKAETSHYWTEIQRSRRVRAMALKAIPIFDGNETCEKIEYLIALSDMKRLRALSTTNFGMATPFLARGRQQAMAELMNDLNRISDHISRYVSRGLKQALMQQSKGIVRTQLEGQGLVWHDTMMVLQTNPAAEQGGNRFISIPVPDSILASDELALVRPDGEVLPTIRLGSSTGKAVPHQQTLYTVSSGGIADGIYHLCSYQHTDSRKTLPASLMRADSARLSNKRVAVCFTPKGGIEGIYLDGKRIADKGSLIPHLKYGKKTVYAGTTPQHRTISSSSLAASITLEGALAAPASITHKDGWANLRLTVWANRPYLLVEGRIVYPFTDGKDLLKIGSPGLMRRADMQWQEVAPVEIKFSARGKRDKPIRILKRNYLDIESEYRLDYFRHDIRNFDLDSVNNHVTESYVGLIAGRHGMAVSQNNRILSNFAFAPLKMHHDARTDEFSVNVNPFGTYHGRQYQPQTWGNRNGYEITLLAGEQFASAGPTYNGRTQTFALLLTFFEGQQIPRQIKRDLIGYAHMPMVISTKEETTYRQPPPPLYPPDGLIATYAKGMVRFNWAPDNLPDTHYRIHCGTRPNHYEQSYPATGSTLTVRHFSPGQPFVEGKTYHAMIETLSGNGSPSPPSPEIRFIPGQEERADRQDAPLALELKVLWANLKALIINSAL